MAPQTTVDPRDGVLYTRNLILRGMCAVYLMAFLSFYYQSEGIYGNNGILPVRLQIDNVRSVKVSAMHNRPTMLHLSSFLGIDTATMMDLLAIIGSLIAFSGFITQRFCLLPTFAALWSLYYSLVQITQTFNQQSDLLLLEAGILCIVLAPLNTHKRRTLIDTSALVLMRWLLFRFMFASGSVKLASGCPTWWSMQAFSHHFETLPLPTPVSWYVHHMPAAYLQLTVVFTYLSELVCPWLFLFPNRMVRRFAFHWQLFLQLNIIVTGNYGFLNFLVVTLLVSLLDDSQFYGRRNKKRDIVGYIAIILTIFGFGFIAYQYFGVRFVNKQFISKIMFSKKQYLDVIAKMIQFSPVVAGFSLGGTFLKAVITPLPGPASKSHSSSFKKLSTIVSAIVFLVVAAALLTLSTVPHGNLQKATNITKTPTGQFYQKIKHLNIVSEYGNHLREMRTERKEIAVEHADHIEGPWTEYPFVYKPWNVNHSLPFAGPYLARLDMKFYEAAGSTFHDQIWLASFAHRLLQNERSVLQLLGIKSIPAAAPKFVRGTLYKYRYTAWSQRNNAAYWRREKLGEVFPPFSLDDGSLKAYLKSLSIPATVYQGPPLRNDFLKIILDAIRSQVMKLEASFLVLSVLAAGFAIIATQRRH